MLQLPSKPWPLWALAMALWTAQPFLTIKYLIITQRLHWYPPQADSIGIPALGALILAMGGFPFWLALCWKAFRNYPRVASLLEWSNEHRRYSWIMTAVFGLMVGINIWNVFGYVGAARGQDVRPLSRGRLV